MVVDDRVYCVSCALHFSLYKVPLVNVSNHICESVHLACAHALSLALSRACALSLSLCVCVCVRVSVRARVCVIVQEHGPANTGPQRSVHIFTPYWLGTLAGTHACCDARTHARGPMHTSSMSDASPSSPSGPQRTVA